MNKVEIEKEIKRLVEILNSDAKRFYSEYKEKFCGDESVEEMIEDYANSLTDEYKVVRLQVRRDYPTLDKIRNLMLELEEVASWNVIRDVKLDFKFKKRKI